VRGFIFDVDTGLLREVQPIAQQTAACKNLGLQDLNSRVSGFPGALGGQMTLQ
jgi:hypothetical protein